LPDGDKTAQVAIVGNMNVGKTSLFEGLCGRSAGGINFPGSTVTIGVGRLSNHTLIDTPGTCSLFAHSEDEEVSRNVMLSFGLERPVEGIVLVIDAKHMKRGIALALQYAEYGLPMMFNVNMVDEGQARGIEVNYAKLSKLFGVEVSRTIATEGIGFSDFKAKLGSLRVPRRLTKYTGPIEQYISDVERLVSDEPRILPRGIALLLLAGDNGVEAALDKTYGKGMVEQLKSLAAEYQKDQPTDFDIQLTNVFNKRADQIVEEVQRIEPPSTRPFVSRLGEWCIQPSTGIPIALLLIFCMYQFVGSFGATFVVDLVNGTLFERFLIPATEAVVRPIPSAFIRDMLIDGDFGVLPTGVFLALGLVLPVLACFYLFFGILEDSGYLPRLAILLDRVFRQFGLNGKGVMPLVMGFSCITMAILTTRMLDTEKEKNIACFLLMFSFPCAPLLGAMLIVLDQMPLSATIAVFGYILVQFVIAGYLANLIIPGSRSPLLLEIPPMRLPKPLPIISKAAFRTYLFVKEALPIFIWASFMVFVFQWFGGLAYLESALRPLTGGLLGLPEESVRVFMKTMIRREAGATELEHLRETYTNAQLVVNMLVMTFLIPCLNAVVVLYKVRGIKAATGIITVTIIYALLAGGIANHFFRLFNITFG
jgi:ferrous iron transport protein B